jgi:hypothetical protein
MYYVVDENNLNNTSGYKEFKAVVDWNSIKNKPTSFNSASHTHAGTDITSAVANATNATKVPWSGVQNPPSTFPPSSHTHGNITNDGKISGATTAGLPLITTGNNGTIDVGTSTTYASGTHGHGTISNTGKIANGKAGDYLTWYSEGSPVWSPIVLPTSRPSSLSNGMIWIES